MNLVSNGWPSSSSLAFHSDSPCVSSGFLHHRMNTFAHRLPVFFPVSLLHLHLYFTEILSVLTAQCRYCPTFIHNYTELISCKDTTFISISCNFSYFSFAFSLFHHPSSIIHLTSIINGKPPPKQGDWGGLLHHPSSLSLQTSSLIHQSSSCLNRRQTESHRARSLDRGAKEEDESPHASKQNNHIS